MKILSVSLKNFASYKELHFDFQNQGLALIQGPTGSGKSTLCDAVPWILFGKTAKGGAVDEVLSWPGEEVTSGTVIIEFPDKSIGSVFRVRGKSKDNDLYYSTLGAPEVRGKDMPDTQRLINSLLGFDYDLYLSAAYFHEFSATAGFFTATAKNRRQLCEQIVDLSLATNLQIKVKEQLKDLESAINSYNARVQNIKHALELYTQHAAMENRKKAVWDVQHSQSIDRAINLYDKFETNRTKVISKACPTCKTVLEHEHTVTDNSENPYKAIILELETEANPHTGSIKDFTGATDVLNAELYEITEIVSVAKYSILDLELLAEVITDYRAVSIRNTIQGIENKTNALLSEHFDAEIRVLFTAEDADKLEVEIYKDGNKAYYTQLSKGQRQLLKLCFGVAVMDQVANHHGIHFDQVFLDEALDGLDETLKIKAFGLLQTLALNHESVLVVEHSTELKASFDKKFSVQLVNGESVINEES